MPSPFPGLDPYLEDPRDWLPFHNALIARLFDDLNEAFRGRYLARITERVVVERPNPAERTIEADVIVMSTRARVGRTALAEHDAPVWVKPALVESREWGIEIREAKGRRVVTLIEILSPSNRGRGGSGRKQYLQKQQEVLASKVHLVEVDLLRSGAWTVAVPEEEARAIADFDYLVSVSRSDDRSGFEVYPIGLDQRLPRIAIPLASKDPDAVADLQSLLDRCYDRGQYAQDLDYSVEPVPPLTAKQAAWARRVLRRARRRK